MAIFLNLFVWAECTYFYMPSNCLKIIRKRKAVGSGSKEKVADRVTVTLLMYCPCLVSHQAASYCFSVFLDSLSFKEQRDGLPSSITCACDCRVTLDTCVPLMASCRTQPKNSDLEYVQASECQEWKTYGHNMQKSCIHCKFILSELVKGLQ